MNKEDNEIGKGIMPEVVKNEVIVYELFPIEQLKKFLKDFKEQQKLEYEKVRKELKSRDKNVKALYNKSKELNKEIPDELLAIIYSNWPVSIKTFEKYKEWFE